MIAAILKLIRFQNLIIIAATQYLIRFGILVPFLKINGFIPQIGPFHFFLLVLSTVLVAAGGYVINDYFDARTDRVNKPSVMVIDRTVPRRWAIFLHPVLSITGIGIGSYLSFYVSVPQLSFIFILASGLLWFYSTDYKKQFLIGNIIVSILTASVPLLVILFELPLLNREYGEIMLAAGSNFNYIFAWIATFSFFAFLTSLIREIVKDAEDYEGDIAYGMKTVPIVAGLKWTKTLLGFLVLFLIVCIIFLPVKYVIFSAGDIDLLSSIYFLLFLLVPSGFLGWRIIHAHMKSDYHMASMIIKFIMVAGLLYALIVRYMVLHQIS